MLDIPGKGAKNQSGCIAHTLEAIRSLSIPEHKNLSLVLVWKHITQ